MLTSFLYKLNSGKPLKIKFFFKGYLNMLLPGCFFRFRRQHLLKQIDKRADKEYILERVAYYNKMQRTVKLPDKVIHEKCLGYYMFLDRTSRFSPSTFHSAYFFDIQEIMRWFSPKFLMGYIPGDVYFTPPFPAFVKSRLLVDDNSNSVLLKLDKFRHFLFVKDPFSFREKLPRAIFRGKIRRSRQREQFMRMYFGSDICDCGVVELVDKYPKEWFVPKKTIKEHLRYKFIMTLEGNDVASNLKWVMASNSIAVMPRPTCETWFMEGKLIPDYHYILIKDDLSDLEERLNYYTNHPEEAEAIIRQAHKFVEQFWDPERELLISLLVAEKYYRMTGQQE